MDNKLSLCMASNGYYMFPSTSGHCITCNKIVSSGLVVRVLLGISELWKINEVGDLMGF